MPGAWCLYPHPTDAAPAGIFLPRPGRPVAEDRGPKPGTRSDCTGYVGTSVGRFPHFCVNHVWGIGRKGEVGLFHAPLS